MFASATDLAESTPLRSCELERNRRAGHATSTTRNKEFPRNFFFGSLIASDSTLIVASSLETLPLFYRSRLLLFATDLEPWERE